MKKCLRGGPHFRRYSVRRVVKRVPLIENMPPRSTSWPNLSEEASSSTATTIMLTSSLSALVQMIRFIPLPPIFYYKGCEVSTPHRKYAFVEFILAQSLRGGVFFHRDDNYADVVPLRARTNDSLYPHFRRFYIIRVAKRVPLIENMPPRSTSWPNLSAEASSSTATRIMLTS